MQLRDLLHGEHRNRQREPYSDRLLGLTLGLGLVLASVAESATLTVVNTSDGAAPGPVGSLRRAIADAAAGDTIVFDIPASDPGCSGGVCTITLDSGEIFFAKPLAIQGPGAPQLRISGNDSSRVFTIAQTGTVTLAGLTVTRGNGVSGVGSGFGGGLFNVGGTLSIHDSAFTDNDAALSGGAFAIIGATLNMTDSTVEGNQGLHSGAFILQDTNATVVNSTVSGNTGGVDDTHGAAILHFDTFADSRLLTLTNCTITDNTSGVATIAQAGAVTTRVQNSLVAASHDYNFLTLESEATSGELISDGSNLDSDGTSGFTDGVDGDRVGTPEMPLDARLAPLADNGGGTATHALLAGSPAINAVVGGCPPPVEDQRGVPRAIGGVCDIGAYESDCGDGVIDFALGEQCDDGNALDDDGCSAACEEEAAGTCLGLVPTVTGAGLVVGTNGADVIAATGGLNIILGQGGDDVICGGPGIDIISGGPGADVCDGGAGKDTQSGCESVANVP